MSKKTAKKKQQAATIAASSTPPQERVDAGLVEKDFEQQPNDGELASGELHDVDAAEDQLDAQRRAGAPEGGVYDGFQPSTQMNPYASEEEQGMEMRPAIVGPPPYGSPRPETSAGRLVPLADHPLREDALPEGHPAAISDDYGVGYTGTLKGVDTVTSRPSAPQVEVKENGGDENDATEGAVELAEENSVNLDEVTGTGKDGRVTKEDVQNFIDERESA